MNHKCRLIILVLSLIYFVPGALAQPPDQDSEFMLEEITVTAQKTEQKAQKTPISMQVYTSEDLLNAGAQDIASLSISDPSFMYVSTGGSPYLAMRGVSTSNTTETGNPSVAVSTDGIFLNRPYSLDASLYDLERIEVLRGPQGTLYGRNAVGGVLNIITAKPKDQFGTRFSIEAGNYSALNVDGMINIPLSENTALRVSAATFYHDGYRNNSAAPNHAPFRGDDKNSKSARMQLSFQPATHFNALLGVQYTRDTGVGPISRVLPFDLEDGGLASHNRQDPGDPDGWPVYSSVFVNTETWDIKWDLEYDGLPGGATLTYLGGWNDIEWHHAQAMLGYQTFEQNEYPNSWNHELRLSSPSGERLFWQAGLYYFKEDSNLLTSWFRDYNSANESLFLRFTFPTIKSDSKAAFAQASYEVSDTLKLTGGMRYTKDKIDRIGTFDLYLFGPDNPIQPPVNGNAASDKLTYTAGVDWNVTDTNLLYAKLSTGYKAGGFTGAGEYDPEELVSYEIGAKNRFNNSTIQLNLAAYLMEYTNQQLNQFSDPVSGAQTVNADSEIYGLEVGLTALIKSLGLLNVNGNYLHAEITDFVPPAGYNPDISASISGNQVPLSPELTVTGSLEHTWPFLSSGDLTGRAEVKYESGKYFSANNFESTYQEANTVGNLSLRYQRSWTTGGNYSIELFMRNVTDEAVFTDAEEIYTTPNYGYYWAPPRTFGVKFSATY